MVKTIIQFFLSVGLCLGLVMPLNAFSFNFGAILGVLKTELYNNKYGLALAGAVGVVSYYFYKKLRTEKEAKDQDLRHAKIEVDILREQKAIRDEEIAILQRDLDTKRQEIRQTNESRLNATNYIAVLMQQKLELEQKLESLTQK